MVKEIECYVSQVEIEREKREREDFFKFWLKTASHFFTPPSFRVDEIRTSDPEIGVHFIDPRIYPNPLNDRVKRELEEFDAKNVSNLVDNPVRSEIVQRSWIYCGFWSAVDIYPFKSKISINCPEVYTPAKQMAKSIERVYHKDISLLIGYPRENKILNTSTIKKLLKYFRKNVR